MKRIWLVALCISATLVSHVASAKLIKLEFEGTVITSYDYTGNLTGMSGGDVLNGHSIVVQVAWESDEGSEDGGYYYSGSYGWLTTRVFMDGILLTHDISEVDMTGWPNGTVDRNNPFMYSEPVDQLMLSSLFEPDCFEYFDYETNTMATSCYGPASNMIVDEYEVVSAYQWDLNNTPEHGSVGYDDLFGLYGPEFWASIDYSQTKTFHMQAFSDGWTFASNNGLDADFDFSDDFSWLGSLEMAYGRSECSDWQLTLGCRSNDDITPEYQNFRMTFSGTSARAGWSTDADITVDEGQWGPLALLIMLVTAVRLRRRRPGCDGVGIPFTRRA